MGEGLLAGGGVGGARHDDHEVVAVVDGDNALSADGIVLFAVDPACLVAHDDVRADGGHGGRLPLVGIFDGFVAAGFLIGI